MVFTVMKKIFVHWITHKHSRTRPACVHRRAEHMEPTEVQIQKYCISSKKVVWVGPTQLDGIQYLVKFFKIHGRLNCLI